MCFSVRKLVVGSGCESYGVGERRRVCIRIRRIAGSVKGPVPETRVGPRTILVNVDALAAAPGRQVVSACTLGLSSHDQESDLERQVARLSAQAAQAGLRMVRVEAAVGSGMDGARSKARRLLADPEACVVVVEHRDRMGRVNTELVEAAMSATGRRMVVLDSSEVDDDLAPDMVQVLTSFCARLYGRRSARSGARKALQGAVGV